VAGAGKSCYVVWNLSNLIYRSPQIVLSAIDLHKDFIDVEGIAITTVLSFQSSSVYSSEFDTPETDRFAADSDASLGEEIFDEWYGTPAVAEI
jgi:hypothetical protein